MEIKEQNKLTFEGVDIIHVNFDAHQRFDRSQKVEIDVDTKVFFPKDDTTQFHLLFDVELNSEEFFSLKIRAIGFFHTSDTIDEKLKENFINTNAPAIVFPYLRAFISSFTSNLGTTVGTFTIPPHIISGPIERIDEDSLTIEEETLQSITPKIDE